MICQLVCVQVLAKKFAALYYLLEDLLSPQKHYDWGLRAIKSVLVVAGSLLRAESGQDEADVLFRALRDFNIPKILLQVRHRLNHLLYCVPNGAGVFHRSTAAAELCVSTVGPARACLRCCSLRALSLQKNMLSR